MYAGSSASRGGGKGLGASSAMTSPQAASPGPRAPGTSPTTISRGDGPGPVQCPRRSGARSPATTAPRTPAPPQTRAPRVPGPSRGALQRRDAGGPKAQGTEPGQPADQPQVGDHQTAQEPSEQPFPAEDHQPAEGPHRRAQADDRRPGPARRPAQGEGAAR